MVPPDPAPPVDDSWWSSVVRSLVCGTTPRVGKSPAGAARRLETHLGDDVDSRYLDDSRYLELAGMRLRASELDSEIEDSLPLLQAHGITHLYINQVWP